MPEFAVTLHRKRILDWLGEYRHLGSRHVFQLFGAATDNQKHEVTRKLRDLARAKLVHCERWVDFSRPYSHFPPSQVVYWFSRRGWELAQKYGYEGTFNDEKSPYSLGHELAITDFHIAVKKACETKGLELDWQQTDLKKTVYPDALFAVTFIGLKNSFRKKAPLMRAGQSIFRGRQRTDNPEVLWYRIRKATSSVKRLIPFQDQVAAYSLSFR